MPGNNKPSAFYIPWVAVWVRVFPVAILPRACVHPPYWFIAFYAYCSFRLIVAFPVEPATLYMALRFFALLATGLPH